MVMRPTWASTSYRMAPSAIMAPTVRGPAPDAAAGTRGWHHPGVTPPDPGPRDPVLARRRQIARAAELGQRAGYGLFGAATVLFVAGFLAGFTPLVATLVVAALVVGSVLLAPAIIAGYAVKAADREDREQGRGS
jgi:hypothetical protein